MTAFNKNICYFLKNLNFSENWGYDKNSRMENWINYWKHLIKKQEQENKENRRKLRNLKQNK